jgi:hypothetical protein
LRHPSTKSRNPIKRVDQLLLRQKGEGHGGDDTKARGEMVPFEMLPEIEISEDAKNREGDNFLDDFELEGRINGVSPAISRHLETIFEEGDAPAHDNHQPERGAFIFQMAVPGDGHEHVGARKHDNGQPAG